MSRTELQLSQRQTLTLDSYSELITDSKLHVTLITSHWRRAISTANNR